MLSLLTQEFRLQVIKNTTIATLMNKSLARLKKRKAL